MSTCCFENRKFISDWELVSGSIWVIGGFVRIFKKIGKLNFAVISDRTGEIQVIFKDEKLIKKESVILIEGELVKRKAPNFSIPLGEWELIVRNYEVLSEPKKSLPFELISVSDTPLETTRLKYRYLDIRRGLFKNLEIKSKILNSFRQTLLDHGFIEVHTPSLSVSSKEGAKVFCTEVLREKKRASFSLSQSPQLYKQLLMIGGLERYFQFANCFRLEDLRADRQYEFLQLDIELSFSDYKTLFSIIELAFRRVFRDLFSEDCNVSFETLSYDIALERYGSDKPDLRHGFELEDYSDSFKNLLDMHNYEQAFGLFLPSCRVNIVEDKWLDTIQTKNKIYILHIVDGVVSQAHLMASGMPVAEENLIGLKINKKNGVLILSAFDYKTRKGALLSLGALRIHFSRTNKKQLENNYRFVWITDWPLFEYNESQGEWVIAHHLFTKPVSKTPGFDVKSEKSLAYDLVLNGLEIASGSERNNDLEMQNYIFKLANLSSLEIEKSFGWFLEAFNYGVPPHLGIALGVDRIIQALLNLSNIREVIAFPKNNSGVCPMTNSPEIIE